MSLVFFVFGVVSYLIFLITFLYACCFVGNMTDVFPQLLPLVPKTIDRGGEIVSFSSALITNVILLGIFAVQHSVMARPAFKKIWTKVIPKPIERSFYVLFSSLALILMFVMWAPMTGTIWNLNGSILGSILCALFFVGWGTVLVSTFIINHFELFGLKQVYNHLKDSPEQPFEFKTPLLYRYVRHPIYFGFLVGFWCTPEMSHGHLLFAVMTTGYVMVGIYLEEKDLISLFGKQYEDYKKKVSMLIPLPPKSK